MVALEATVEIGKRAGADAAALWQVIALATDTTGRIVIHAEALAKQLSCGERSIFRRLSDLVKAGALKKLGPTSRGTEYAVQYPDAHFGSYVKLGSLFTTLDPDSGWTRNLTDAAANPDSVDAAKSDTRVAKSDTRVAKSDTRVAKSDTRVAKSDSGPRALPLNSSAKLGINTTAAAESPARAPTGAIGRDRGGARETIKSAAAAAVLIDSPAGREEASRINDLWRIRVAPRNASGVEAPRYGAGVGYSTWRDAGKVIGADALRGALDEADRKKNASSPIGLLLKILADAVAETGERDRLAEAGRRAIERDERAAAKREEIEARRANPAPTENIATPEERHAIREQVRAGKAVAS